MLINENLWFEQEEAKEKEELVDFSMPQFFNALQKKGKYYKPYVTGLVESKGKDNFVLFVQKCKFLKDNNMFDEESKLCLQFYFDFTLKVEVGMEASFYFKTMKIGKEFVLCVSRHNKNRFIFTNSSIENDPVLEYIAKQRKMLDELEKEHMKRIKNAKY